VVKIGNAPVSYGAFEVTVGIDPNVPSADEVLDAVQTAGYEGIDLGPVGFFGLGPDLRKALAGRGLLLAGGYVEVDPSSDEAAERGRADLAATCDQFDAVGDDIETLFLPRPTVALVGSAPEDQDDRTVWERIYRIVGDIVDYSRSRGYEACLHNEVGTQASTQDSIERILTSTEISLCLDTGHLVAAGGDPLEILERWWARVSHIHLKDAKVAPGDSYDDAMKLWENDVFCKLGAGTAKVDEILGSLRRGGYDGWLLVEQDVLPRGAEAYAKARTDQIDNRAYLRSKGW
jgi:inosose dehydratase